MIDNIGNTSDIWQVTHRDQDEILASAHHVLGFSYHDEHQALSIEGYRKTIDNQNQFIISNDRQINQSLGSARMTGVDVFLRKKLNRYEALVSYSLAQVEEQFARNVNLAVPDYDSAPQDHRHELKGAVNANLKSFEIAIVQVLGTGVSEQMTSRTPYQRSDFSCQYNFAGSTWKGNLSASVLNIFDRRNVRLNQSINVPDGDILNTVGIPLSVNINLNLEF